MPDAVVLVDPEGTITYVNHLACTLFGYGPDQLVGQRVEMLLPRSVREQHVRHRETFQERPTTRPMAAGRDLYARHRDGRDIPVDIGLASMTGEDGPAVAAFVRDATVRQHVGEVRQQLHDAQVARRHALELNDNVLQGLTTAIWQLDQGDADAAQRTLDRTLAASRQMVKDLLDHGTAEVEPGDLIRAAPAPATSKTLPEQGTGTAPGRIRVVLADDAADVRLLLRARLSKLGDIEVVGEAADGEEAIAAVDQVRPDVIVLDLSMPRLDGLQATERLRERYPDLRIVVLSGYPTEAMRSLALEAGADEYLEKGPNLAAIEDAVRVRARI